MNGGKVYIDKDGVTRPTLTAYYCTGGEATAVKWTLKINKFVSLT
jgi:hypothetical protein